MKKKAIRASLIISVLYVGLGTVSILSIDPEFFLSGDWAWFSYLLTLPVSIVGFLIMYTEKEYLGLLIPTQLIVFAIFWFLMYRILLKKYIRKSRRAIR